MDIIFNYLHQGLSAIIPFVILLGILVFVHELGHFLVAKYFGVRVEIFSLGFGKKLISVKRGDTTYCLSLIPLGGYVKMFGDEVGADIAESEKQFSFSHKPVGQRIAVVVAGPAMNFFFTLLLFFVIAFLGEDLKAPFVGDVPATSLAAKVGFKSGDQILEVQGEKVETWDQVQNAMTSSSEAPLTFKIQRDQSSENVEITVRPTLKPNPNILSTSDFVGEVEGLSTNSTASIVGVEFDSAAYKAGLRTGDRIAEVNGKKIELFRDLQSYLGDSTQTITKSAIGSPNGEGLSLRVERYDLQGNLKKEFSVEVPKVNSGLSAADLFLAKIVEKSPADKAGFKEGDKLLSIDGVELHSWEEVLNTIKNYNGATAVKVRVLRDGQPLSLDVTPQMTSTTTMYGGEEKRYTIGIVPMLMLAAPAIVTLKTSNPLVASKRSVDHTLHMTGVTILSFLRVIQAKISPKNFGGVIAIGQAAKETFKIGISHFLQMMAIISINLCVLNLLPIPVLDGGHLLFYSIEAIRGAPVSMRKMEIAQQFGLVVLLSLMLLSFFNDITRLVGGW